MKRIQLPYESLYVCKICGYGSLSLRKVKRCEKTAVRERPEVRIGESIWRDELMRESCSGNGKIKPICWIVVRLNYSQYGQALRFGDDPLETHTLLVRVVERDYKFVPRDKTMAYAEFLQWRKGGDSKELELAGTAPPEKPANKLRSKFWRIIRIFSEI